MDDPLVSTLLLVVVPALIALGAYALLRRRGSRTGTAGCGAVLLGLLVSGIVIGFMILSALR